MKKLFIMCLVLVMLPLSALADAIRFDLSLDIADNGLDTVLNKMQSLMTQGYMDDLTGLSDASEAEKEQFAKDAVAELKQELSGMDKMIDGARLQLMFDESALDAGLYLRKQIIAGAALYQEDGELGLTIDLLPGLLIGLPSVENMLMDEFAWLEEIDFEGIFSSADFDDVFDEAADILEQWAEGLKQTEKEGNFAGETYEGGVMRLTVDMDERDLMLLASALMHLSWPEELQDAVEDLMEELEDVSGLPFTELGDEIHRSILSTALENRYAYQLHVVEDDMDVIGMSLIILEGEQQIASLSLGGDGETTEIVLSYGVDAGNVYLVLQETAHPTVEDCTMLTFQFIQDPYRDGRYVASQHADNILLTITAEGYEDDDAWTCNVSFDGALLAHTLLTFENSGVFGEKIEMTTRFLLDEEHILSWTLTGALLEEDLKRPDFNSLIYVPYDSTDAMENENVMGIVENAEGLLMVRLFRAMPVELILQNLDLDDLLDIF